MNIFIEPNINANIRKLVLMNILEINKKRNNEIINSSLNKIDINALLKYFINLFDKKIDFNLYSILLETIVLLGENNEGIFDKLLPDIFSYLIKLMKLFETMNKKSSIIMSLSTFAKTFKKYKNETLLTGFIIHYICIFWLGKQSESGFPLSCPRCRYRLFCYL